MAPAQRPKRPTHRAEWGEDAGPPAEIWESENSSPGDRKKRAGSKVEADEPRGERQRNKGGERRTARWQQKWTKKGTKKAATKENKVRRQKTKLSSKRRETVWYEGAKT